MSSLQTCSSPVSLKRSVMQEARCFETSQYLIAAYSCRSPTKETVNEDAAAIIPINDEDLVLIVADGVGGLPRGEHASATALSAVRAEVNSAKRTQKEIREAVLQGMEKANSTLLNDGVGSATTLAVVEIHNNNIRSYHAGDSLVLSCGQRGKRKLETIAHSPVGYAFESGILTEHDAFHHEERHLVSNIVGSASMHISVCANATMEKKDTLIVATDGLFDNVQKEEIVEIIRKGPLEECSQTLIELAQERMASNIHPYKADDMTFIMLRLHD